MAPNGLPPLTILLAAPRGFCAGVERAIQIVELALEKYGAPVYVRHEIVHNRYVVEMLRAKGAIFVEELDEIPDGDAPVVFSAHGVPKAVPEEAERRRLFYLDATCPLVSKVHIEAEQHHARGREVLLIGHAGHPEVIGTMGQLPEGSVHLIESILEPSRTIAPGYESITVALTSGRVLAGVKVAEDETKLTLGDEKGDRHEIRKADIEERASQPRSTMPDGLEKRFTNGEFLDLLTYLVSEKNDSGRFPN